MSEDAPTFATSEEGHQVPVRYEGSTFAQTDAEGKSLLTGEDLSPGSSNVGENYEHNPDKARVMAEAGNQDRSLAADMRNLANEVPAMDDLTQEQYEDSVKKMREQSEVHEHNAQVNEQTAGVSYETGVAESAGDDKKEEKPIYENYEAHDPNMVFVGHVEVGRHPGDAYFHKSAGQKEDGLEDMAIYIRRSNQDSHYSYSTLGLLAEVHGVESLFKGRPVEWDEDSPGREVLKYEPDYNTRVISMALERSVIEEKDILKAVSIFQAERMQDKELLKKVAEAHGFPSITEWEADVDAKYKAARESEAKDKGYASVEELESAEEEEFYKNLGPTVPQVIPPRRQR